jgi:hypothetical protein
MAGARWAGAAAASLEGGGVVRWWRRCGVSFGTRAVAVDGAQAGGLISSVRRSGWSRPGGHGCRDDGSTYGAGDGKVLDGSGTRTAAGGAGHGWRGPWPRSRPIWAQSR